MARLSFSFTGRIETENNASILAKMRRRSEYNHRMGISRCLVVWRDGDEERIVQADASSLFEAVAMALRASRGHCRYEPGPFTEFRVTSSTTGEHHLTYRTLQEFLVPSPKGGPRAVNQRARLRAILEGRTQLQARD
jgi:hypothetical protein